MRKCCSFFYLAAREWDADDADRLLLKELVGDRHCCECVMGQWGGFGMMKKREKRKKNCEKGHVFKSVLSLSLPNQGSAFFFPQSEGRNEKKNNVGAQSMSSLCSFLFFLECPTTKEPLLLFFSFGPIVGSLTLPARESLVQGEDE